MGRKSRRFVCVCMTPELQDDIGTVGYVEFVSQMKLKWMMKL